MSSHEVPVGFVERLPDGTFNRYLCPVKTRVETIPVYLTKTDGRKVAGYYDGANKGLPPSSTWSWILERVATAERRIPVYYDVE